MLWPQPHVRSPRAAEEQDLCHLCSHLLPLRWHPLGIQRATSWPGPKGPRVSGVRLLGLWGGSGCAFSNQDLPFHTTPVQDHMAESESQGSLRPSHFFLLFVEKSAVLP